jgi:ATP-binding cassette subfamily B protein
LLVAARPIETTISRCFEPLLNSGELPIGPPNRPWLAAGETVRVECQLDLSKELTYGSVTLALTEQRLVELGELVAGGGGNAASAAIRASWPVASHLSLRAHEQGGMGHLELVDSEQRLAVWYYTSARSAAVARLVKEFNRLAEHGSAPLEELRTVCPSCGKVLPEGETECAECAVSAVPPPARSLLRLWQFAARHLGLVGLGLALTLAATGASLIPPRV